MEAVGQEEARQTLIREEATRASSLAAEAATLAAALAVANAIEQEHRMAVQAAMALKTKQDKELALPSSCLGTHGAGTRHCKGIQCPARCITRPHMLASIIGGARSRDCSGAGYYAY